MTASARPISRSPKKTADQARLNAKWTTKTPTAKRTSPGVESARRQTNHTHWAGDPDTFDEADREAWVDTFSDPETLQGGFDRYVAADEDRKRLVREGAPAMDPIEVPTRILWGEADPIVKSEWADQLDEYFANYRLDTVPDAGHFVHERPELANEAIESFFADLP